MHTRALHFEYYCKLTAVLSGLVTAVCATLYIVFLLLAVGDTATRTQAQASIAQVTSDLGSIQTQYILATQSITPERATVLGFVQPASADLTYIDTSAPALSFNVPDAHANVTE